MSKPDIVTECAKAVQCAKINGMRIRFSDEYAEAMVLSVLQVPSLRAGLLPDTLIAIKQAEERRK